MLFRSGTYRSYTITPEQFGLKTCNKEELLGGTPEENAAITRAILDGTEQGAKRGAVLMNAGAGLFVAGKALDMAAGIALAAEMIDSGKAYRKLEECVARSNE